MEKMKWYEIIGERLGLYRWCRDCNKMRWLHGHERPENIQCPVCGYYCAGNGGVGCIDKPSMQTPNDKGEL